MDPDLGGGGKTVGKRRQSGIEWEWGIINKDIDTQEEEHDPDYVRNATQADPETWAFSTGGAKEGLGRERRGRSWERVKT